MDGCADVIILTVWMEGERRVSNTIILLLRDVIAGQVV